MLRTDRTAGGRYRVKVKRLAAVLAVLALAGTSSVGGATKADSGVASNSAKLAGAFVNWGPVGRERTLQAWEQWLNQAPTSVVGVDFYAEN
ncbi:MAG: hypothetical protein ACXU84_25100, partial [Xanthobacteraceae bacterium]